MKRKHNGGYSLIEILIAIAVLGIVTIPATTSLLTAHRVNVQAEKMLTAQLQVSSAVETLMAVGIVDNKIDITVAPEEGCYPYKGLMGFDAVAMVKQNTHPEKLYYEVTVRSTEVESVSVTTHIRAVPEEGGE